MFINNSAALRRLSCATVTDVRQPEQLKDKFSPSTVLPLHVVRLFQFGTFQSDDEMKCCDLSEVNYK